MSNFTDFISGGGGGGANTYTPSTATAGIDVVAGSAYALSSSSQLLPSTDVVAEEADAQYSAFLTSSESSSSYNTHQESLTGDRCLPDGSNLVWYQRQSYDVRVTLSKDGSSRFSPQYVSVVASGFQSSLEVYQKNIGQTATNYLVAYRLHYYKTNGTWSGQAGILKINKTTGAISNHLFSSNLYASYSSSGTEWIKGAAPKRFGNQHTCRGGTVYVDTFHTNTYYLRVGAQPLDSTGSPTGSAYNDSYSNITDNTAIVGNLIKIDDANGIFLHFFPLNSSNLRVAKVTVASTGAVTTSVLETYSQYSGISTDYHRQDSQVYGGGTGSNNLFITFSSASSGFSHMLGTYDLSDDSITWGTSNWASYGSGFSYSRNNSHWREYKNQRTYDADNKRFYMGGEFNSGNGFVLDPTTNTLTEAELNSKLTGVNNIQYFQMHYNGGIISFGDKSQAYNQSAYYAYGFDSSIVLTQDPVAVVLASGSAGSTVNIALKDGITSSSTLPSTHYLSKSDLYFPYAVEGVSATSVIKSIQRGSKAFYNSSSETVTIAAVDLNKAMLIINGHGPGNGSSWGGWGKANLSNSTTIQLNAANYSYNKYFEWQVIEYV